MVTLSNVNAGPAPTLVDEAPPAAATAPASRFSKVQVHDERTATAVDSRGRAIKVRKLSALDRVRLFRALGATDSENKILQTYAATAAAVTELDGAPVPFPSTSLQLDALIGRLDETGLEAAVRALIAVSIDQDEVAAEAKGF